MPLGNNAAVQAVSFSLQDATPLYADQNTGVTDTQATRLHPQQHLKTAELAEAPAQYAL